MKYLQAFLYAILFQVFLSANAYALTGIKAAFLVNLSNGQILYERNPDLTVPPASLAKIMTMFLTFDAIKSKKLTLNQKLTISSTAAHAGGSAMRITAGDKMPVVRLLAGMAVSSGNDAATALAEKIGGTIPNFVTQMNAKAKKLGMKNTKFKNPTGLPAAGQKTTARDLFLLCKAYLNQYPQARRFHKMKYFVHQGNVARNTNPLLGSFSGVDGLKTGWTISSGYNLIVTANKDGKRFLAIILGGQSKAARDEAAVKLLEAAYKFPSNPKAVNKILATGK